APLLDWLGVREIRDHDTGGFGDVAILDLPDVDSTTPEHRARVDELLPRVDAVVWVADPEKYRDAVLHDDYLRRWAPRLARQLVVVNKADRMPDDVERVREHLASSLRDAGLNGIPVAVTSRSEEHTSELQSPDQLVCRLLLEKEKSSTDARRRRHQ